MPESSTSPLEYEKILTAARLLRDGCVVAHPTETLYGLAVDPFNPRAVKRLIDIKGREAHAPFILLLGRASEAHDLANLKGAAGSRFDALVEAFWPGPLTLVLQARRWLRCPALRGSTSAAMRLSPHPIARQLALQFGGPITSTSANRAGQPAPTTPAAMDPAIAAAVDLVLEGGPQPSGSPSTLLDLTVEPPRVLRRGAITAASISEVMGVRVQDIPETQRLAASA